MKRIDLLYYLFVWLSHCQPVIAQVARPCSKILTIMGGEVSRYAGKTVKLNCARYKTSDDGKTLTVDLYFNRQKRSLLITLTGAGRKKILNEMRSRRDLNRQIESPLDTSITATGRIVLSRGRLYMLVGHAADVYLGADLQLQGH